MNKKCYIIMCVCLNWIFFSGSYAFALDKKWSALNANSDSPTIQKVSLGAKYHFRYDELEKVPLDKGDLSYLIFYEIHNDFAYWQLGGAFTPGPSDNRFDSIMTPQINLIVKDRFYRLGVGALSSRVKAHGKSEWKRLYWQVLFGLGIPLGSHFSVDLYGHYVFEKWQKITQPAHHAPDISLMLTVSF